VRKALPQLGSAHLNRYSPESFENSLHIKRLQVYLSLAVSESHAGQSGSLYTSIDELIISIAKQKYIFIASITWKYVCEPYLDSFIHGICKNKST